MAIILYLKEPKITLYIKGEIKDDEQSVKEWDEMFDGKVLITRTYEGKKIMMIPLDKNSNIVYGINATDSEIEERKLRQKEFEKEQMEKVKGSGIVQPTMVIPPSRRR